MIGKLGSRPLYFKNLCNSVDGIKNQKSVICVHVLEYFSYIKHTIESITEQLLTKNIFIL